MDRTTSPRKIPLLKKTVYSAFLFPNFAITAPQMLNIPASDKNIAEKNIKITVPLARKGSEKNSKPKKGTTEKDVSTERKMKSMTVFYLIFEARTSI
ncbi:MAG: hypothetical protein A3B96_03785 [Candidatus Spechtbacteria bacterium RIFCSPHIGHO2_02_FULL_43_15b]|nr:MAG: hypothetical protein A3B96_03785 [Candidatus Spechtbacteria bacterium RIFCSPHIGHO2_02_FULL_43_15b]